MANSCYLCVASKFIVMTTVLLHNPYTANRLYDSSHLYQQQPGLVPKGRLDPWIHAVDTKDSAALHSDPIQIRSSFQVPSHVVLTKAVKEWLSELLSYCSLSGGYNHSPIDTVFTSNRTRSSLEVHASLDDIFRKNHRSNKSPR